MFVAALYLGDKLRLSVISLDSAMRELDKVAGLPTQRALAALCVYASIRWSLAMPHGY